MGNMLGKGQIERRNLVHDKTCKLMAKFKKSTKYFSYDELSKLLNNLGFQEIKTGKTGGSRCKFYHEDKNLIINLHKPHPSPYLKGYIIISDKR